jgi:phage-related protein
MEGVNLGLPVSRPMPIISHGVHELRLKDKNGQFRIFYFLKAKDFVLVFHLFKKKSQAMPIKEIQVARMRLKEML